MSERWESQERLVTQLSAPVGMSWWTHTNTQKPPLKKPTEVRLSLRSFHTKPSLKSSIICSVECWLIRSWTLHQYAATGKAGPFVLVLSPSIKTMISRPRSIRCVKTKPKKEKEETALMVQALPQIPISLLKHTAAWVHWIPSTLSLKTQTWFIHVFASAQLFGLIWMLMSIQNILDQ